MGHKLENGAEIRIYTDPGEKPEHYWLDHVNTQRAKYHIEHRLNLEKLEIFKKLIFDIAKAYQVNLASKIDIDSMKRILNRYGARDDVQELRQLITREPTMAAQLLRDVQPTLELSQEQTRKIEARDNLIERCPKCQPLPGDNLMGLRADDGTVMAHRDNCPDIPEHSERKFCLTSEDHLKYTLHHGQITYPVLIEFKVNDRPGILSILAGAIGELGINIVDVDIVKFDETTNLIRFLLMAAHQRQVGNITRTIRKRASDRIAVSRPFIEQTHQQTRELIRESALI